MKKYKEQPEFKLQQQVCEYLRLKYKNALFMTDSIAAVKLTAIQAARNKSVQKAGFRCPDLLILEPKGGYCGLFIELKIESVFKSNGELKQSWVYDKKTRQKLYDHIAEQNDSIEKLNERGHFACFSWGFNMTIAIIDRYMGELTMSTPNTQEFYEYFKQ